VKTDVITNTVVVGEKSHEELSHTSLIALDWHWIGQKYELPLNVKTKIRYRQEPQPAMLISFQDNQLTFVFDQPQRAVASGQVVVAYIDDECIGSGIIS
jgi:tRNA-specific 2-thiouridylase